MSYDLTPPLPPLKAPWTFIRRDPPIPPRRTADDVARSHRLEINQRILRLYRGYSHGGCDLEEISKP